MNHRFTIQVVLGMLLGMAVGLACRWLPLPDPVRSFIINGVLDTGGKIFFNLLKLLVVPIVLVSLIHGAGSLGDVRKLGRVGGKTILLYLFTTAIALFLAITVAKLFGIGKGLNLATLPTFNPKAIPSLKETLIDIVPSNPFLAFSQGKMLQIIVFALLFGMAMAAAGDAGKRITNIFADLNAILMKLIIFIMRTAPYGVFCLLAVLFAKQGFSLITYLASYFATVLVVLLLQMVIVYSGMLSLLGKMNPLTFFKKMYTTMLFAFSVSSSNASIPVVLKTVEDKLGVDNSVAAFVIPLGSTINMDGTAIMQGVATVFIAHAYGIQIGLLGYATVMLMATLASIGTAGVPSVGLITLAMVLNQVGLPVQGIALIIGVDRLLDMARTAVNISGDSMVACLVGKSEKAFDEQTYQTMDTIIKDKY